MKTTITLLTITLTIALLVVCSKRAPVQAQIYGYDTITTGIATVAAGATSNTLSTDGIASRLKSETIAVQFNWTPSAVNATNLVRLIWVKSLDGSNWSTDTETWTIPGDTSGANSYVTNWTIGAIGSIKLKSIVFLAPSGTLTNEGVLISSKRAIP